MSALICGIVSNSSITASAISKPRSPDGYAKIINMEYLSMSEVNLKRAITELELY